MRKEKARAKDEKYNGGTVWPGKEFPLITEQQAVHLAGLIGIKPRKIKEGDRHHPFAKNSYVTISHLLNGDCKPITLENCKSTDKSCKQAEYRYLSVIKDVINCLGEMERFPETKAKEAQNCYCAWEYVFKTFEQDGKRKKSLVYKILQ